MHWRDFQVKEKITISAGPYSRTRPARFPENRVDWLGKMMTHYYRASLSGIIFDRVKNGEDIFDKTKELFCIAQSHPPGTGLRKRNDHEHPVAFDGVHAHGQRRGQRVKNKNL